LDKGCTWILGGGARERRGEKVSGTRPSRKRKEQGGKQEKRNPWGDIRGHWKKSRTRGRGDFWVADRGDAIKHRQQRMKKRYNRKREESEYSWNSRTWGRNKKKENTEPLSILPRKKKKKRVKGN